MTDREAGFRDGYLRVVTVLELVRLQETHLNPHTRNILNQALDITISELKSGLEEAINAYTASLPTPPR